MEREYSFNSFSFNSLENATEFINSLMVEGGYELKINTKFREFPRENSIEGFQVIGKKLE